MRPASLGMWPDSVHLENEYRAWTDRPMVNEIGQFVLGLMHEESDVAQIEWIAWQARAAREAKRGRIANYTPLTILALAALHVLEEYAWPEGFPGFLGQMVLRFAAAVTTLSGAVVNGAFSLLCALAAVLDRSAPVLGLSLAALLILSALTPTVSLRARRCTPGLFTGMLPYLPPGICAFQASLAESRATRRQALTAGCEPADAVPAGRSVCWTALRVASAATHISEPIQTATHALAEHEHGPILSVPLDFLEDPATTEQAARLDGYLRTADPAFSDSALVAH